MVVIRLSRGGTNNRPFYHFTVADSQMPRDGRYIERVGYFNPIASGADKRLLIDLVRVEYWLSQGAQLSERVDHLIKEYKKSEQAQAA